MSRPPITKAGAADFSGFAIERRSLSDPVADRLREMIVHGEFGLGARIPIADVARDLDVSATPLREALKVLAEEGLVEFLPGRGVRVLPFTLEEARSLFEVMANLEGLAAGLAVLRLSAEAVMAIEAMHAAMVGHFDRGEKEPYFDLNSRIHAAVVAGSGNPVLASTWAKLNARATRGRYVAIVDPGRWREAMDEHEELMAALRARDEGAAAIWQRHLRHTGEAVERAIRWATGQTIGV